MALLRCFYPFLPEEHRPYLTSEKFGTLKKISLQSNFTRRTCSRGCSHSLMFRLPCLLGPPIAPTYLNIIGNSILGFGGSSTSFLVGLNPTSIALFPKLSRRPGLIHHAEVMRLPNITCGIATCPNRAIDTTGLDSSITNSLKSHPLDRSLVGCSPKQQVSSLRSQL